MYCKILGWEENCVAIKILYCRLVELVERQNCIATVHCIVAGRAVEGKVVSQYNLEYCGRRQGCLCRKTSSYVATRRWDRRAGHTADAHAQRGRARGSQADAGAGAWVSAGGELTAGRHEASEARAAWVRGLATGCALGALGLFSIRFDSVLFLSRFLDIVREPGS